MKGLVFCVLVSLFMAGCSTNLAQFSFASTGNIPIPNLKKADYVTGKSCIRRLFGIPFGERQNRVSAAVAKALEVASKKGLHAEAMSNVTIKSSSWSILVYGQTCIQARGQPVEIKDEKNN